MKNAELGVEVQNAEKSIKYERTFQISLPNFSGWLQRRGVETLFRDIHEFEEQNAQKHLQTSCPHGHELQAMQDFQ